jgi:hypothetical protein
MTNLLPILNPEDRPRALFHGLSAVARDSAGAPPRFGLRSLPATTPDLTLLQQWFREFVEVRDTQAAERCLVSAIVAGATPTQLAEMLFSAATDHRLLDGGHTLDFTNKAFEALDATNWQDPTAVLSSLVRGYTTAERMEESSAWRYPVDLVAIVEEAFTVLPTVEIAPHPGGWSDHEAIIPVLLGEDPHAIVEALLKALQEGATATELAGRVAYAAALRIAHFHTHNDLGDWDTAHHTFTFANAVDQALRRVPTSEVLRGVFDAAMRVYLDRFLNVPPARLPDPSDKVEDPQILLKQLPDLLDRQQQVNAAASLVGKYLYSGGDPYKLMALLGHLLLREDRDFHSIQNLEAACRQYTLLQSSQEGFHVLIATTRYIGAHAPTLRSQGQTYQMAQRLSRGERVFEESAG